MNQNDLMEIEVVEEDRKIRLRKTPPQPRQIVTPMAAPAMDVSGAQQAAAPVDENQVPEGMMEVHSPMVGTFYRSPSPDSDHFVEEGAVVAKGDVLCIIEAMKVMNEIKAEFAGTIREIKLDNGQPVEYGQTLFLVQPE